MFAVREGLRHSPPYRFGHHTDVRYQLTSEAVLHKELRLLVFLDYWIAPIRCPDGTPIDVAECVKCTAILKVRCTGVRKCEGPT